MTIPRKIDPIWAESGTVTPAPSSAKIESGWVGGDRPTMEYMNYNQNKAEVHSSNLAVEGPSSIYEDAADPEGMIATGLWSAANTWGQANDTPNSIYGGAATKQYVDLKTYFDSNNDPYILALDLSTNKIDVFDPRGLTLVDTSDLLTDDLPAPAGATWKPYSMCTDNTHVYVCFVNTNPNPDTYQIQSWLISDWSVNTGWPATGTALPTSTNWAHYNRPGKVIIANSTKLAALNSYVPITAATSGAISIIDKATGVIDDSGAGDAPNHANSHGWYDVASDGTNIYFPSYNGTTTNYYISTCTIADPDVGCGGAGYPLSVGAVEPCTITNCGPNIVVSTLMADAAAEYAIITHSSATAELDRISIGQDSSAGPVCNNTWLYELSYNAVFDGINLWFTGCNDDANLVLIKIDSAKFTQRNNTTVRQLNDVTNSRFIMHPRIVADVNYFVFDALITPMPVTFDGRDIWYCAANKASVTTSGYIFRLPMALIRH